jgi:hypothetical protein
MEKGFTEYIKVKIDSKGIQQKENGMGKWFHTPLSAGSVVIL